MDRASNAALAEPWKDLWNGNLGLTDKIIAEDFVAHAAPTALRIADSLLFFQQLGIREIPAQG